MIQRIRDLLHERAIARQAKLFSSTHGGDARREWAKLQKLVLSRSPQQVERMEAAIFRRLDPHAQQIFQASKEREKQR